MIFLRHLFFIIIFIIKNTIDTSILKKGFIITIILVSYQLHQIPASLRILSKEYYSEIENSKDGQDIKQEISDAVSLF